MVAAMVSYVAAMIRPIKPFEISVADLGLLSLFAWSGIILLANDGIPTFEKLWKLLWRVSLLGGIVAVIGIIQFVTKQPVVNLLQIPGLSENQVYAAVSVREGFTRPASTAVHPIEFGVVMSVILPIAVTCGIVLKDKYWLLRWLPALAIGAAIPLSISRTAIVGSAVAMLILLPSWTSRTRRWAIPVGLVFVVGLFLSVPGILGTISGLFTSISGDPSARSRTDSYAIAWDFIQTSPFVGRGFGTFLPAYWIFDNQYVNLMVETGIFGTLAMIALIMTALLVARRAARRSDDERVRHFGYALAASVGAGGCCMALYDLLAFPMSAGLLFLIVGLSGAIWRLQRESETGSVQANGPGGGNRVDAGHLT
ncbi:hypothetical protein GORHZ_050_00020 [Gordonia rhizosphera NBRC 16068]|uniref:O-antigen ligase-related domain-containing protein n=2 Tax=Gordonia rhizosphera TaxID=83341 RepID=K6VQ88_9ACTN|nr:hypothetical protein GORHZ_050_00020 [Gordonia rhizosphera NBRC 16068]